LNNTELFAELSSPLSDPPRNELIDLITSARKELRKQAKNLYPQGFVIPAGKPMRKQNTANPLLPDESRPQLTLEEANAVNTYTSNAYKFINAKLRNGQTPDPPHDDTVDYLQGAFAKAQPFPAPMKMKRGMDIPKGPALDSYLQTYRTAQSTGAHVAIKGFSSSGSAGIPTTFQGNIRITIFAKKGLDVQPYTEYPREKELLLDHNTEFRVIKCAPSKKNADVWSLILEQII